MAPRPVPTDTIRPERKVKENKSYLNSISRRYCGPGWRTTQKAFEEADS